VNQSVPSHPCTPEVEAGSTPSASRRAAIDLARALWLRAEVWTVSTYLNEGDDQACLLCSEMIVPGPAWAVTNCEELMLGYVGVCCFDLATKHGVTRWETEHNPPGMPMVPAHLATAFPPNVIRLPLPRRA
jgi:hypothetical protein